MTELQKAIARATRLLALAEGTSNPNEAAAAFAQAQKILERYKLSRAELELAEGLGKEAISDLHAPFERCQRLARWKDMLLIALCDINDCHVYFSRSYVMVGGKAKGTKHYRVVGRTSDVETCRWFYTSIRDQIEAMCKSAMMLDGGGKGWANSFKLGAMHVVQERLIASKAEVRQEWEGTRAMVLIGERKVELTNFLARKELPG